MAKPLSNLTDAEIAALGAQVVSAVGSTPGPYGIVLADVTAIDDATTTLQSAITAQINAMQQAKAATATKETAREALIALLRSFRDKAKAHGATDAQMQATGIPQGAKELTPPTATVPIGKVDTSRRLQHKIEWAEATTPDNKKRPRGVMGADIYCKIDGPPPTDASQCHFVTTDSESPYLIEYSGDDAGKMAHYMLRWRFRDGGVGAWGETVSATITG
ncbi:MAG: hypothetical protein JO314_08100 [Acidobacteria bacterium]|nr:hypothetical protein [Acidobacteriota bacterium]